MVVSQELAMILLVFLGKLKEIALSRFQALSSLRAGSQRALRLWRRLDELMLQRSTVLAKQGNRAYGQQALQNN